MFVPVDAATTLQRITTHMLDDVADFEKFDEAWVAMDLGNQPWVFEGMANPPANVAELADAVTAWRALRAALGGGNLTNLWKLYRESLRR